MKDKPALPHACRFMRQVLDGGDTYFVYSSRFREYLIKNRGGNGYQQIRYCLGCGKKLPSSLRDQWFDKMEQMGIDPWLNPRKIPVAYRSDEWWRKRPTKARSNVRSKKP